MTRHITSPRSRLATYTRTGKVLIRPYVPRDLRARVRRHEVTEYNGRRNGLTQRQAHRKALKVEHRGMSRHQIAVYEGRLGAVARWKPRRRRE